MNATPTFSQVPSPSASRPGLLSGVTGPGLAIAAWMVGPMVFVLVLFAEIFDLDLSRSMRRSWMVSQWAGLLVLLVPVWRSRFLRCPEGIAMLLWWTLAGISSALRPPPYWVSVAWMWGLVGVVVYPPLHFAWRCRRPGRPAPFITFWLCMALVAGIGLALQPLSVDRGDPPLDLPLSVLLVGFSSLIAFVAAARSPVLYSPAGLAVVCYWVLVLLWFVLGIATPADRVPSVLPVVIALGLLMPLSLLPRWWRSAAAPTPRQA